MRKNRRENRGEKRGEKRVVAVAVLTALLLCLGGCAGRAGETASEQEPATEENEQALELLWQATEESAFPIEEEASAQELAERESSEEQEDSLEESGYAITPVEKWSYCQASLVNIRSLPGTDGSILGQVAYGESLFCTGVVDNGWLQICYGTEIAYVNAAYFADAVPETAASETVASETSISVTAAAETAAEVATTGAEDATTELETAAAASGMSGPLLLAEELIAANTWEGMTQKEKLDACFSVLAGYPYTRGYGIPGITELTALAEELLTDKTGNCYRYAAAVACVAAVLGYEVRLEEGTVAWNGIHDPHGWAEIRIDGVWYIYDGSFGKSMLVREELGTTYLVNHTYYLTISGGSAVWTAG